jgi:hypothetical protein
MAIKPVQALTEPWLLLTKDFGYYILRTLASIGVMFAALLIFFLIAGIVFAGALASAGLTDFQLQTSDFNEIASALQGLMGVAIGVILMLLILVILNHSVVIGLLRDFAASVIEGKKQYTLFANLGLAVTYFIAILLLMVPIWLLALVSSALGLWGMLLFIPLALAYAIFLIQFQILPVIVGYKKENGFKGLGTNWNILRGQRWSIIGAAFLFFLALIPVLIVLMLVGLIPFLGSLLTMAAGFMISVYSYVWLANLYKQAIEK